jgi:hypothetical protein
MGAHVAPIFYNRKKEIRMSQVKIKFTATGCNTSFGNFVSGDIAVVSRGLANHFVSEQQCAEFVAANSASGDTDFKETSKSSTKKQKPADAAPPGDASAPAAAPEAPGQFNLADTRANTED